MGQESMNSRKTKETETRTESRKTANHGRAVCQKAALWKAQCLAVCVAAGMCGTIAHAACDAETGPEPMQIQDIDSMPEPDVQDGLVSGGDGEAACGQDSAEDIDAGNALYDDTEGELPTPLSGQQTAELLVPENLNFVIDPWNVSGQGQIHSRQFAISNSGSAACTLYLEDIVCRTQGEDSAVVVTDVGEIYSADAANIYLEMVFATGDSLTLSQDAGQYSIVLEPGSGLTFWLTGKVNEKTQESWEHKEVSVAMKYCWTQE